MTLDDLEGVIALILCFFPLISISLPAKYVAVVEYKPIISINIVSQFQSSTLSDNWPTLQRSLSAIAELLVYFLLQM